MKSGLPGNRSHFPAGRVGLATIGVVAVALSLFGFSTARMATAGVNGIAPVPGATVDSTCSSPSGHACGSFSNSGAGDGAYGSSASGSGIAGAGVFGVSGSSTATSASGAGVSGDGVFGVVGQGTGADGVGVQGQATGATAAGVTGLGTLGVQGTSAAAGGSGVYGENTAGSGFGVYGTSAHGTGVEGDSTASVGVRGISTDDVGVLGKSSKTGGVLGQTFFTGTSSSSTAGVGGIDSSGKGTSTNYGVLGTTPNSGAGVAGVATNAHGALGNGVYANSDPTSAPASINEAVALYAESSQGAGIYSYSDANTSGYFESGKNSSEVTLDVVADGDSFMFNAENKVDNGHVVIDDHGNILLNGEILTDAHVGVEHRARNGQNVETYAAESSEATVEDYGTGTLVNGRGAVALESRFAATIDPSRGYLIFLTPDGDCRGLYVATKSPSGFVVRELQGGHASLSFDYRIVARPADAVGAARLPNGELASGFARAAASTHRSAGSVAFQLHRQQAAAGAQSLARVAQADREPQALRRPTSILPSAHVKKP